MEVISWKNMPIFTEIFLLLIRQNAIPKWSKALSMELCFVINLTKDGNWAIYTLRLPPIFAKYRVC